MKGRIDRSGSLRRIARWREGRQEEPAGAGVRDAVRPKHARIAAVRCLS